MPSAGLRELSKHLLLGKYVFAEMIAEYVKLGARQTFTASKNSISRNMLPSTRIPNLDKGRLDITEKSSANGHATWHLFAGCHGRDSRHTSHKQRFLCLPSTLGQALGNDRRVSCPMVCREPYSAYIAFAVIPCFDTRQT